MKRIEHELKLAQEDKKILIEDVKQLDEASAQRICLYVTGEPEISRASILLLSFIKGVLRGRLEKEYTRTKSA